MTTRAERASPLILFFDIGERLAGAAEAFLTHNGRLKRQYQHAGDRIAAVLDTDGPDDFHAIVEAPPPGSDVWNLRDVGLVPAHRIRYFEDVGVLCGHDG